MHGNNFRANHGASHANRGQQRGGQGQWEQQQQECAALWRTIHIKPQAEEPLPVDLFSTTAEKVAKMLNERNTNRYTQVRKFYDELTMWQEKINQDPEKFMEYLPFVQMLNAKAAYAQARKHVSPCFVSFIQHCLTQMDTPESFRHGKLFFEAFMGYYRVEKSD